MSTRILIADDSPMVRQCLGRLLSTHEGWEVCGEAIDGADAVRKAQQLTPDVIVIDFFMPRMNGIEASRQIAQLFPRTPILLCTIYASRQLVELARDAGIAGTLSKNDLHWMVPGIEAILRGKTFFLCDRRPS